MNTWQKSSVSASPDSGFLMDRFPWTQNVHITTQTLIQKLQSRQHITSAQRSRHPRMHCEETFLISKSILKWICPCVYGHVTSPHREINPPFRSSEFSALFAVKTSRLTGMFWWLWMDGHMHSEWVGELFSYGEISPLEDLETLIYRTQWIFWDFWSNSSNVNWRLTNDQRDVRKPSLWMLCVFVVARRAARCDLCRVWLWVTYSLCGVFLLIR